MLKLSYTEAGLHMERSMAAPEVLIAQRVVLALRLGQPFYIEPGRACFLLPDNLLELQQLETALRQECSPNVTITPVDHQSVEVSLSGSWIAASREAHTGMFLAAMSNRTEFFIYRLWQISAAQVSSLM